MQGCKFLGKGGGMPELPEVEGFRKTLESTSLGMEIGEVEVLNSKVLDHISASQLSSALKQKSFSGSQRHGKYLLVRAGRELWVTFHFGMTGFFRFCETGEKREKHDRVVFIFSKGTCLSFNDQRLFGRVGLVSSPQEFISLHKLGPDALSITENDFFSAIEGKNREIKVVLMDQELMAGMGNEYSDQILYEAGIFPGRRVSDLSGVEMKKLYTKMRYVLTVASRSRKSGEELSGMFMLKNRKKGIKCPRCTSTVQAEKFGGRTGYYCPQCQV